MQATAPNLSNKSLNKLLKQDVFGRVSRVSGQAGPVVVRELAGGRRWARPLARRLLGRERRALRALAGIDGVPALIEASEVRLTRSWIAGLPMHEARPADPAYFRDALRLLNRLHRRGVVHNDLAKEPNWLVDQDGAPALLDFQLALVDRQRGALFRLLAREDLRHLLKHKRTYCPERLTARQRTILARPSWLSRLWMATVKPLYRGITRGLLGSRDREGAAERFAPAGPPSASHTGYNSAPDDSRSNED